MTLRTLFKLILVALVAGHAPAPSGASLLSSVAWADSDDDDDGRWENDDDDDDDGARRPRAPRRARPVSPPVSLPTHAADEIVTLGLAASDLETLTARGYRLLEETYLGSSQTMLRRLGIPPGVGLVDAREAIRELPSGQDADFNHFYRPEQTRAVEECRGAHCGGWQMVGWTPGASRRCGAGLVIGLIDTGINPEHEAFSGSRIELHRLTPAERNPSNAVHGTGIAAILIGAAESRSPGLLPEASLIAVDVFHRSRQDERADVFTLLRGLDLLASRDVLVINLSLAGPHNNALERMVSRLGETQGVALVAAAGNAGHRAAPAFPAAYPGVIAVTAVDRNGTVYRRAGRGPHIDFSAPGVDVWTAASVKGARGRTGTSYAAPFVTAAVALVLARRPGLKGDAVAGIMARDARDLGEPGRDDIFGHGIPRLDSGCAVTPPVLPASGPE